MGKLAQGTSIIKLFPGENLIESFSCPEKLQKDLILITKNGFFIKHSTKEIKISRKGELGTIGINFKANKGIKDRVISCFINNKYVYIKTDQDRYKKLINDQIYNNSYKKEKKLNIELNNNEFIKSTFSMIIPEEN
jgi:DNA gyrase subunit A